MTFVAKASTKSKVIGAILASIHLVISWWVIVNVALGSRDAQWQLIWIYFWIADFPISLTHLGVLMWFPQFFIDWLPYQIHDFKNFLAPSFIFGFLGPLWYFLIPILIDRLFHTVAQRFRKKIPQVETEIKTQKN